MGDLSEFVGNRLTQAERYYRLGGLHYERSHYNEIDIPMLFYLDRINVYPWIVTTQCCWGHNEDSESGRRAHVDFRCAWSADDVVDLVLRPFQEINDSGLENVGGNLSVDLMTECKRLRYCLWLDNVSWREQLEAFIGVLAVADGKYWE